MTQEVKTITLEGTAIKDEKGAFQFWKQELEEALKKEEGIQKTASVNFNFYQFCEPKLWERILGINTRQKSTHITEVMSVSFNEGTRKINIFMTKEKNKEFMKRFPMTEKGMVLIQQFVVPGFHHFIELNPKDIIWFTIKKEEV